MNVYVWCGLTFFTLQLVKGTNTTLFADKDDNSVTRFNLSYQPLFYLLDKYDDKFVLK